MKFLVTFLSLLFIINSGYTSAGNCDDGQGIRVSSIVKVDEINKTLFVISSEETVIDTAQLSIFLKSLESIVISKRTSWPDDWCVSIFAHERYASYKDDPKVDSYVRDGSWARNYMGEYDNSTKTIIIYPLLPQKRYSKKLLVK